MPVAVVLFTRSLRWEDNTALLRAARECRGARILPLFVLNPEQADADRNTYFSGPAFRFMLESVLALADGGLRVVRGRPEEIIGRLGMGAGDAVYDTVDYTPFARARAGAIRAACEARGVRYVAVEDIDLVPISDAKIKGYRVFTPYYEAVLAQAGVARLRPDGGRVPSARRFWGKAQKLPGEIGAEGVRRILDGLPARPDAAAIAPIPIEAITGGRAAGLRLLAAVGPLMKNYGKTRDEVWRDGAGAAAAGTTHLSAHIKFGTVSIREVARASIGSGGARNPLLRQLLFRSYYYQRVWHDPDLMMEGLRPAEPPRIVSPAAPEWRAFVRGDTGWPLIDAGIQELYATGLMHNRVRLLIAHHAIRSMGIAPPLLERWFAVHLVDYDPILTNAGVREGVRAFHVMKPESQARRFDPKGVYVKRWGCAKN